MSYQEPQIVNKQTLDDAKKLMDDRFSMMVKYFLEDAEIYISEINRGITEKNIKVILSPAHTVKSSAQQLGVERLAMIASDIEELCRSIEEGKEEGKKIAFEDLSKNASKLFIELEHVIPILLKDCK